jgi:hypothetical protein
MGLFDEFVNPTAPAREPERLPPVAAPVGNMFDEYINPAALPPQEVPARPPAEMRAADPSWTQWAKWKLMGGLEALGMRPHAVQHFGNSLVDVASMTPMGSVFSAADLTHDLPRGHYGAAAFDALGALPLVNTARKIARGYPTIGNAVTPSTGELRAEAGQQYRAVENAPVEYHPDSMGYVTDTARRVLETPHLPTPNSGVFSPEKAPEVYSTLDRFNQGFPRGGTRQVFPDDFEVLRQQLQGLPGANGPAGRQAIDVVEAFRAHPPGGAVLQGTPADFNEIALNQRNARGNWRSALTAEGIDDAIKFAEIKADRAHSGKNLGNATRQEISRFIASKAGQKRLFGATEQEREAIADAVAGDLPTNAMRWWSNYFGGGGGLGARVATGLGGASGAGAGYAASDKLGVDPITGAVIGGVAGKFAPFVLGPALRNAANARSVRAAEGVSDQIRMNSPLYRDRVAAAQPVADPAAIRRDIIAHAMMPALRQQGTNWWDQQFVPYENR